MILALGQGIELEFHLSMYFLNSVLKLVFFTADFCL